MLKFNKELEVYNHKYTYDEVKAIIVVSSYCAREDEDLDYEDVMIIGNAIFQAWSELLNDYCYEFPYLNLQDIEEEGYIQKYAERVVDIFVDSYKEMEEE